MSIKKKFAGATIRKPGAYSRDTVSNSAGSSQPDSDVIFLIGESSKGAPGSTSGVVEFASERLADLVATFGNGPIVDMAIAARDSALAGQNINGPSKFQVYKTNASTQASAMLTKSSSNIYQVKGSGWGLDDNNLSVIVAAGDSGNQKSIGIAKLGDTTESLGENAAQTVLTIQYTGNGTTAVMTITGSTQTSKTLATTLAGDQTDSSANLSITLKNYTMKSLVDYINSQIGYVAVLSTVSLSQTPGYQLDPVTAQNIKASPQSQRRTQYEILDLLNTSDRVQATIQDPTVVGIIDNATTMLTGGTQGISTNSSFSTGLANSLAEEYNALVVGVSRDASEDIADVNQGFTDPSSTYTVSSVLAAASAHLNLRSDVKNRKEAQGFGGVRKSTKAAAYAVASGLGSALMQICIQDCLIVDAEGSQRYMHPHVLAAMAAGMRTGADIGEPLTFKYINAQQVGHFINPLTGLVAGDFNPDLDFDNAIDAGILFTEKNRGGNRWVVDCTTYGIDESFVYNRGSVVQAVQFVDKSLREVADDFFIGKKISNGFAQSLKTKITAKLLELNAPDVNVITSSNDAPDGFVVKTFTVSITGNTATISVEYKPVQGLDFAFFNYTLGDIQQSA